MDDDIRARLLAKLDEAPPPPLEATRAFLRSYVADADSLKEIHGDIARMAAVNPRSVVRGVEGIEALLADPPASGTLARLVAWDGNHVLDDPSDESAGAWLREIAAYIRSVLGDRQSPTPTGVDAPAARSGDEEGNDR
jgi:hypothetical protein